MYLIFFAAAISCKKYKKNWGTLWCVPLGFIGKNN